MPVFGIWLDDRWYFTSNKDARKAKNLAENPKCAIAISGETLDLIIEGKATKIREAARLQRLAEAYDAKYEWHLRVQEGAYWAGHGASSAGAPPYELYEVRPTKAFGLAWPNRMELRAGALHEG